jgi:FdhE protein
MMPTSHNSEILTQLREAKNKNPAMTEVYDLQCELLEVRNQIKFQPFIPQYSEEEIRARLESGLPLLQVREMVLEWDDYTDLYTRVCHTTARHRPDLAPQFDDLLSLLDDDPDVVKGLTATYLDAGHLLPDSEQVDTMGDEGLEQRELLNFLLNHSLRPFLEAYAERLVSMLRETVGVEWVRSWQRGICPVCGGEPDLAFLDEESGNRHLVCSRCDSYWLFPRIKCPFCDSTEPDQLSYYPSTDNTYRVYVCANCQRYLKAVDLRLKGRRVLFPVERVLTVDLDLVAREQGYQ